MNTSWYYNAMYFSTTGVQRCGVHAHNAAGQIAYLDADLYIYPVGTPAAGVWSPPATLTTSTVCVFDRSSKPVCPSQVDPCRSMGTRLLYLPLISPYPFSRHNASLRAQIHHKNRTPVTTFQAAHCYLLEQGPHDVLAMA